MGVPNQATTQPVEELIAPLLMQLQVARRMEGNGSGTLALAPDAEGDLLGHGATRHEDRRLFAEESGDLALEVLDLLARTVVIDIVLGVGGFGELRQHVARPLRSMPTEETLAALKDRSPIGFGIRLLSLVLFGHCSPLLH